MSTHAPPQTPFTSKNLPGVPKALQLAKEVVQKLAPSGVLLRTLPPAAQRRANSAQTTRLAVVKAALVYGRIEHVFKIVLIAPIHRGLLTWPKAETVQGLVG